MAIGVAGNYYFSFSLGDQTDFISDGNLIVFRVVENPGNVLPEWEIQFITANEEIQKRMNEGNSLNVSYGRDPDHLVTARLVIERKTKNPYGQAGMRIYANGHFMALEYTSNPGLFISDKKSGVEAIRDIVTAHFTVRDTDWNIQKSEDSQRWIQPNVSDRRFVTDIWMHSFVRDSFLCVGITADGRFVLKDMRVAFAEEPKWVFTTGQITGDNQIVYDSDPVIDSKSGFVNSWMGRGRERVIHNIEQGTSDTLLIEPEPLTTNVSQLARQASLVKRHGEARGLNENVHPQYWEAYMRNVTNQAVFSAERLVLSFAAFNDIQLLDTAIFQERGGQQAQQPEGIVSGQYIVGTVARELTARLFGTTIELFREASGELEGSFREQGESTGVAE